MPALPTKRKDRLVAGKVSRLAVTALFGWTTILSPVFAQTSEPTPTPPPVGTAPAAPAQAAPDQSAQGYSLTDLEYLLGPIALYPDPLLALIMPASSFPEQIVDAAAWIAANPQAVQRGDFSELDTKLWDPSVVALARFPDVIKLLSEHLDWTESLGWAFAVQPNDVATVTQLLRAKAEKAGNLQSTPQQTVTTRQENGSTVIQVLPADPERIYVPVYDSSVVFDTAVAGALVFGTAVLVGSAWNNRWGWNDRRWNQIWIGGPGVRPRPPRPGPPPGAWRPDRPGQRPDRPGVRPDRPGMRPDRPGVRPDRPGVRPDRPGVRPDRPGVRPDMPGVRPDRPGNRPERPGDRPGARPDRPNARPDRPGARPDRPNARPERPASRPETRPSRPADRPNRPQAGGRQPGASNRPANVQRQQRARPAPQQRARPQPSARPQQPQRARPQQSARPPQQRARPSGQGARPQQQRARPQRSR
jgi:hypothetical protein